MAVSWFLRAAVLRRARHRNSPLRCLNSFLYQHTYQTLTNPDHLCSLPPPQRFFYLPRSFSSAADESKSEWLTPSSISWFRDVAGETFDDPSSPVLTVMSSLDGLHHLTGLPWWMVIASSTVAVRLALLPLLVLQLKKLKRISELFPSLPPPFPSTFSGSSFAGQFSQFLREKRAVGCPSFLWFLPYVVVQVPCFFLLMTSIRRMSLDHHPGFDCGGALWFQNLTAFPDGVLGPIFPILIASLHYINVQISFDASSLRQTTGLLGLLIKYYKLYLDILSLPLLFVGYYVPQGSLIYWVTNSSFNVIQQLSLKHPVVASKFGLLVRDDSLPTRASAKIGQPELKYLDSLSQEQTIPIQDLTPEELLALSVQLLSKGERETAIHLLQFAIDKDPGYVRGLVLMGQALLQKVQLSEATMYLERAISKLLDGRLLVVEDEDLLKLASQWAGAAYVQQGKLAEGIAHLERVAKLKEPEDSNGKTHYFDALLVLSSALYREGRRDEAAKYLHLVVAYNPAYAHLLEQCKDDQGDFASDLVSTRRGDYH